MGINCLVALEREAWRNESTEMGEKSGGSGENVSLVGKSDKRCGEKMHHLEMRAITKGSEQLLTTLCSRNPRTFLSSVLSGAAHSCP